MNFSDKLLNISRRNASLLCIGLDPDSSLMPKTSVFEFNRQIIEATKDIVCAYKPNLAFFEALGTDGMAILEKVLGCIPDSIPVIADAKRSDIGNSARMYARALFDSFGFDAATVNPYLGHDSIEPFTAYAKKGVFILCSTSNPGAADFQQLSYRRQPAEKPLPLFELVAMKSLEWNHNNNIGLVAGATNPDSLKRIRELCRHMPLLIPGLGKQGGEVTQAVLNGVDEKGEKAILNSSRQILYASQGKDFPDAARREASKIRDEINSALASH